MAVQRLPFSLLTQITEWYKSAEVFLILTVLLFGVNESPSLAVLLFFFF